MTRTARYKPVSRNHFLKVGSGKSDHATLSRANARNRTRAEFCDMNLRHWNERETRITTASRMRREKIVRSSGLPSSKACPIFEAPETPRHMVGVRDAMKKSQIRGTHNASELLRSRAGSKQKRATRETSQIDRTKVGDIMV